MDVRAERISKLCSGFALAVAVTVFMLLVLLVCTTRLGHLYADIVVAHTVVVQRYCVHGTIFANIVPDSVALPFRRTESSGRTAVFSSVFYERINDNRGRRVS